jgi:uncharacterized protein (DUF2147 family)
MPSPSTLSKEIAMTPRTFLAGLAAATLAGAAAADGVQPPLGRWITESGNLEVEIAPCGEALCGKVVRVLANRSMSAPGAEMQPADPRPALGMQLLSDFRASGDGEFQGRIYNRENAKHYSASLRPAAADQLLVHAYVGLPLFGKTQVWRRAAAAQDGK